MPVPTSRSLQQPADGDGTRGAHPTHDVVVLGGGAAGLSAALTLVRARRSVLVIDSGEPRNRPAAHMHGFLSRDGESPMDLLRAGRDEVLHYGGRIVEDEARSVRRTAEGFALELARAGRVQARRLLVATGLQDELPDVPGLRERWGNDVLHCPYCHGWEVRDQPIGVLATGPYAVHQALMFRQWSKDVTVVLHNGTVLSGAEAEELAARGITVLDGPATGLRIESDALTGLRLGDGTVVPIRALAVFPRVTARTEAIDGLGVRAVHDELGDYLAADENGKTDAPGVWAAGNVTDVRAQVVVAAAAGNRAGAAINSDLIAEELRVALVRHRAVRSA